MDKIRIGFVSFTDPLDRRGWSGTFYQLFRAVNSIDGVEVRSYPYSIRRTLASRMYNLFFMRPYRLYFKTSYTEYSKIFLRQKARSISKIPHDDIDLWFAPVAVEGLHYFKTDKPIIYLCDGTFPIMEGYYDYFSNFPSFQLRIAKRIEKRNLNRCWRIISASDWLSRSLRRDFGIPDRKIRLIEFGANFDDSQEREYNPKPLGEVVKFLFVGVEWVRKGAQVAIETVAELNRKGIKSTLTIAGLELPDQYKECDFINCVGFLNTNDPQQAEQLRLLYVESDVFLLPTVAECAGIVFAEASAYGLPIFTCDTGGVPNYVINGENGYRLDMSSGGVEFADKIKDVIDQGALEKLGRGGVALFNNKLNWRSWKTQFEKILDEYRTEFEK